MTETETESKPTQRPKRYALLIVLATMTLLVAISCAICYQALKAEAYARYMGIRNNSAEKIAKIIRGVEMNAQNTFEEVYANVDSAESVIKALESKANLNLDVRGYFAAFEPNYFPEKGTWFEPYIYQPEQGGFEYRQVGSARHNYHKSPWYIEAKSTGNSFWSDPYYYYDGTSMSGHYCTFIKPLYDKKGQLVCVCGADMKFEWLAKELEWVDNSSKYNKELNKYHVLSNFNFFTIILNNDGTSIVHPGEESMDITDEKVIQDLMHEKGGVAKLTLNGQKCMVYYGPVEFVNWTVAVVVPEWDFLKPMTPAAVVFLTIVIAGMALLWMELKKR